MATKTRTRSTKPHLAEYRRKRDFEKTPEPRGHDRVSADARLEFVIQKHQASHLHFDLRLEMEGVMKSWAVPKGPDADPKQKRLAMEVEDHPMEYNDFEGTIPKGEYGGGTVMLWDRGTYTCGDALPGEDPQPLLLEQLRKGRLHLVFHGKRIRGAYSLVRTSRGGDGKKPQWLLIKHDDRYANLKRPLTQAHTTSVVTRRTMDEIAAGKGGKRVWRSNRGEAAPERDEGESTAPAAELPDLSHLLPMKATKSSEPPRGKGWTYEPKYDGIRVLAFVGGGAAALITNNGNDKAISFPEIVDALRDLEREVGHPLVLDGELVALVDGEVARFGKLQGRMHVSDATRAARLAESEPAALLAFDVLLSGEEVLLHEPWRERRNRLEALLEGRETDRIRVAESTPDCEALLARARSAGWEGIMAKRTDSPYRPATRSQEWLKLVLRHGQEFVVGGWTDPKGGRKHFGSLLLGYYTADGTFTYAGQVGTGFNSAMLSEIQRRLKSLERKTPPFAAIPEDKKRERPHWVRPQLVVQVEFNGWTEGGYLRQASFQGLRDDKDPKAVIREPESLAESPQEAHAKTDTTERAPRPARKRGAAKRPSAGQRTPAGGPARGTLTRLIEQMNALCEAGGGTLQLPEGDLPLTNLKKVYYPKSKGEAAATKGELIRYYLEMSPYVLPWMAGRPLVLKRFPNGIQGEAFYQQTIRDAVPEGVRVETLLNEEGEEQPRLVGGNLATLLYTIQLGAISYDPWHSRVGALAYADYTILDLDPLDGTPFRTVVEVARLVKAELDNLGLHGAIKTSGSTGLHIYLPLPPETPLEAARLVAEIVATRVAYRAPKIATIERTVRKRRKGTVYVDYLQNIQTKTVAGVYAARAKPGATVSTPLEWSELDEPLDLRDFTIRSVPERVRKHGDLWAVAMREPISMKILLKGAA